MNVVIGLFALVVNRHWHISFPKMVNVLGFGGNNVVTKKVTKVTKVTKTYFAAIT